jgi:sugar phosphate isomerase/epimerase
MLKTLGLNAIGILGRTIPEAIDMARAGGFDAITFDIRDASVLADRFGIDHIRGLFSSSDVRPGSWSLPVRVQDPDLYTANLIELPKFASLGAELGCPRVTTGIMPGSNERTYDENYAFYVEKLRLVAERLNAHGCRLGIEFISPKTLRAQFEHEFIYTMAGMLELAREIGTGNVGLLLDSWHLYAAGESVDDIDALTADDVVVVHVNDAPAGIRRDEQIDNVRALPLETGVLEIVPFMKKLAAIGFDGPVMPEPFSQRINDLAASDPGAAVRETAESMTKLWTAAGLG